MGFDKRVYTVPRVKCAKSAPSKAFDHTAGMFRLIGEWVSPNERSGNEYPANESSVHLASPNGTNHLIR